MNFDPKFVWQNFKQLSVGESSHNTYPTIKKRNTPNVQISINDEDNEKWFRPKSDHVYNNHQLSDNTLFQQIRQRTVMTELE